MTLKEPDIGENSALAEFLREIGDAAARASPSARFPKRAKPKEEPAFEQFPSPHESAAAQRYLERRADPEAKSQLAFVPEEATKSIRMVSSGHDKDDVAARLVALDTFATGYYAFSEGMLAQVRAIAVDEWGQFDVRRLEQIVAMIQGIGPRNELEAMLAVQMVAVQLGTMKAGAAAASAQMREHQHWANSSLARLARTFAAQVDSLKNLRLNGTQHIHIHHHRGGDGPEASSTVRQSHAPMPRNQRNQTGQSSGSSPLQRQIKTIAKGLPRPRSART